MKILLVAILSLFSFSLSLKAQSLNLVRETYFGMNAYECNALQLSHIFENNPPSDPLLIAYYGAASAAAPACIFNPATKISYFRNGKRLLAKAIQLQPSNFEIRFLRFATQTMTPGFLGYNDHIGEDKAFLLSHLEEGRTNVGNSKIFAQMLSFLSASDFLTPAEKNSILRASVTKL